MLTAAQREEERRECVCFRVKARSRTLCQRHAAKGAASNSFEYSHEIKATSQRARNAKRSWRARATDEFNQEFLHKRLLFPVHEAEACLPSPGVGGVHGGSALLGPAAADAEGVVLGRGRGRKREHFKLGVVFMIACVENSLFWSRAAAGRQAPPAACDSLLQRAQPHDKKMTTTGDGCEGSTAIE